MVDRSEPGVSAYSSPVSFPQFNLVAGANPFDSDWEALARRVSRAFIGRGVPWMWWTTPSHTSPGLESTLADLGLISDSVPGMYSELTAASQPEHEFEITQVPADDPVFSDILIAGFELPAFTRQPMRSFMAAIDDSEQIVLVVRRGGQAVGVGSALVTGETLGIYNIATAPESRRAGVGTAATSALMDEGRNRGCSHAILHTSEMGRPVYERLGFREVCRTTQWVWLP